MEKALSVGDVAVYPVHGVAEVIAVEDRVVAGHPLSVYILKVRATGSTIMVPTVKADAVGLRAPISEDEVAEVYGILRSRDGGHSAQPWNRRQREYNEKIKSGSIFEIAEVYRELRLLGQSKELSFSERRMADTATSLLVAEVAIARDVSEAEILHEIDEIFALAA
ncbi:MAG: CarD family transcriptional regulator [Proteobacteria bacterium]|nr:CarD family transcriptional regulator [Pseudomonadota bacterium]